MNKLEKVLNNAQRILFVIVVTLTVGSFVIALGSENMTLDWIAAWLTFNLISLVLCIYVRDPRIVYRRLIPILMCIGSLLFKPLKPILRRNGTSYAVLRKCYKIRKMAGTLEQCYIDIQDTYDDYSGYSEVDTEC